MPTYTKKKKVRYLEIYRTFLINSDLICQNLNQCLKNLTTYERLNLNFKNIFLKQMHFVNAKELELI